MAQEPLNRAVELIQNQQRPEARTLLVKLLQENPDNAAAWWLLAHAAPNREIALQALEQVRRLRPGYARVETALAKLGLDDMPPVMTLAELLSNVEQRLLPDEPADEPVIDELDAWLDIEEKRKHDAFSQQHQERRSRDPMQQYGFSILLVLIGVVLISSLFTRVNGWLAGTSPDVLCYTDDSSTSALASINHPANPDMTLPQDIIRRGELALNTQAQHIPLDGTGEIHAYTYAGSADERLLITVWGMDYGMNPLLEVYDPSGHQLAYCDDYATDNSGVLLEVRLPSEGTYTLLIYQRTSETSGDYGLDFRAPG
ncbi:MAG: hypothetical protein U0694_16040 [Anaerolineae bacterium]